MPLTSEVRSVYTNVVTGSAIRYITSPANAAATAMVSDGAAAAWAWAAYVQIVAAAVIPDPCWLAGYTIHTGVVGTINGDCAIATGAGAAEVDLAMFSFVSGVPSAVGVAVASSQFFPLPIYITGQPRTAGRIRKSTGAGAEGFSLKTILATGISL